MARRPDARPGRPDARRNAAFLDRYDRLRPAGAAADAPPSRRWRPTVRAAGPSCVARPARARRRDRPARPSPAGTAEVRAATPDLTIVTRRPLRRPARPAPRPGHGRPGPDEPPKDTRPSATTSTEAFLAVLPGASGFKLTLGGSAARRASRVAKKTKTYTLLRLDLGAAAVQRQVRDVPAALRPRRHGRRGRPATCASATRSCRSRSGRSPPTSTPGSTVTVVFPAGLRGRGRGGRHPGARRPTATGRIVFRTGQLAKPLTFFAYLVADRPGAVHRHGPSTATVGGTPVELTIRAWPDDTAVGRAGRRPGRAGLPGPRRADRPALAARRRPRRPGGGQPLDRRLRRAVRPDQRARSRSPTTPTTSWSSTRPPTPGSTARCWPTAGRTRRSRRTTALEAARTLEVKATGRRPDRRARGGPDPAQRLGRGRARGRRRPRTTPTPLARPRPGDRRAGRRRRPPGGLGRRGRTASGPTSRRRGAATRRRRTPETGRRTARLARPARPARGADRPTLRRPVADLGRARRPTCRCSTRGRAARTRTTRSSPGRRLAAAAAVRDAMRAWRFDEATALLDDAERGPRPAGARSRRPPPRPGSIAPDTLRTAFEGADGFDDATARRPPSSRRSTRYATPRPRARPTTTRSVHARACGARRRRSTSTRPATPSRRAT